MQKEINNIPGELAIMAYFDLPPCKKVGEIKDLILNAIISGELQQDDEEGAMLEYAKKKMEIINENER